jgi:hypothetical protein
MICFMIYVILMGLYYLIHIILFSYDCFMTYRGFILGDHGYTRIDIIQIEHGNTIIV